MGPDGKVRGRFRALGIVPKFVRKFKAMGIPIPYDFFDSKNMVDIDDKENFEKRASGK